MEKEQHLIILQPYKMVLGFDLDLGLKTSYKGFGNLNSAQKATLPGLYSYESFIGQIQTGLNSFAPKVHINIIPIGKFANWDNYFYIVQNLIKQWRQHIQIRQTYYG